MEIASHVVKFANRPQLGALIKRLTQMLAVRLALENNIDDSVHTTEITLEHNGQYTQVQMMYMDFLLLLHGPTQTAPVWTWEVYTWGL